MSGLLGINSYLTEEERQQQEAQQAPAAGGSGGLLGIQSYIETPPNEALTTTGVRLQQRSVWSAGDMDEATDIMAAQFHGFLADHPTVTSVVGTVGKVLQPLAAPQQILFAGIKATEDALDRNAETSAWETLKRGGRSALSFATWGGYQAAGLGQGDPRSQMITGYELFKGVGAPNWVARWAGTAADFVLDVPLVGQVGKAAKLDNLTAGLRIGENMAQSFTDPGALRAFAGNVAAAPFTTQPLRRLNEAVPRGVREAGRARFVDPILNSRRSPRDITQPVSPTLAQTWINRNQGVADEVVSALERKNAVTFQYAILHNEALDAMVKAREGLRFEDAQEIGKLVGRLADESDAGRRATIEGQIQALEQRTGKAGLYDQAIQAVNKGIAFDTFSAEKLGSVGLMSPEAVRAVQAGDKRHLRRVYAMYGERADDQIRRIMDRGAPASVTFDRPKLEQLYTVSLNRQQRPTVAPQWDKSRPAQVQDWASNVRNDKGQPVELLDPVADLERLVWRQTHEPIKVGTVDQAALDLPNQDMSTVRTLKNILGEDAVQKRGGRWRLTGHVTDSFPVGHPDIQRIFGDLEERGLATAIRWDERSSSQQVPNWYRPDDSTPREVQFENAYRELDESVQRGALYVRSDAINAFMAGATEAELDAVSRAMERFPLRQATARNGRGEVDWFPIDPADPAMTRLIDRANGGAAALFDGVTGQPTFNSALQQGGKLKPNLPSPKEFADAVERAYTNADLHPVEFLNSFFRERGMTEKHIETVLDEIGKDWAERTGIQWKPSDDRIVRHFTQQAAAGHTGASKTGTPAVTTGRIEIDDAYAEVLGEIEDFSRRIQEQNRVVSKVVGTQGVIQDIRKYLLDNDLIENTKTADMGSIYKTSGLRVINGDFARKLGNDFKEGDVIPAEIHRILWDEVNMREPAKGAALAWQWYSSRWQGIKLANPMSIATNFKSTFVMADQMGYSVAEMAQGMADYLRLMRGARQADGVRDSSFAVNGVTMEELFNNGGFVHNTMFNAEVAERSNRLMDELANPAGDRIQRSAAALQEWLTETSKGAALAKGYATAVTPIRWLGDTYGRVDSLAKGGLYMALRKKGTGPEQAAKIADEVFFNYSTGVPYAVDGIRKLGLVGMPFVSFKFLATGRFFRSLYQNPYGVQKYYRLNNSSMAALQDEASTEGGESAYEDYVKGSPDYIKGGLYIPLGKDSLGRHRAVRLDDILPETSVFDAFNADGVAGIVPPAISLVAQIMTGKGYQNRNTYRTGGGFADTWALDKEDAARGVVKSLWQFGAYPWMPGQPQTERLVKAIADKSIPVEAIQNPVAQGALKLLSEGPAAPLDPQYFTTERRGSQPVPDIEDALARYFGVYKSYPVEVSLSQPGTARSNKQGAEAKLQTLEKMLQSEMRSATTDEQRQEIIQRYRKMREPHLRRLRE